MIEITIQGRPIAKKRPRFARRGAYVAVINDQETEEGRFLLDLRQQVQTPLEGPVCVEMIFVLPRPKGHFGTGKNACTLKPSAPRHPTSKPDLDNLEKFVSDCCNGVLWADDNQVVQSVTRKQYANGSGPMTVIRAWEAA